MDVALRLSLEDYLPGHPHPPLCRSTPFLYVPDPALFLPTHQGEGSFGMKAQGLPNTMGDAPRLLPQGEPLPLASSISLPYPTTALLVWQGLFPNSVLDYRKLNKRHFANPYLVTVYGLHPVD